jgi:branched-chain amino acid transport system permease protein
MLADFLQFLFAGLTIGAMYALSALGFTLIYNASGVLNFAQGEFIMLGGICTVSLMGMGLPIGLAIPLAVMAVMLVGVLIEKLAIERADGAEPITLIIITIGASLVIRGLVQVTFGKHSVSIPAFSGDSPIRIWGATLLPQTIWVLAVGAVIVAFIAWFMGRTWAGKTLMVTAQNKLAASLVGVDVKKALLLSFALSAALGAIGGILVTPITYMSYDAGTIMGLKGFVAATLGGMGSALGAVLGGLVLGALEALTAGYVSSAYKDAMPFVLILLIFFFRPEGILGKKSVDRV